MLIRKCVVFQFRLMAKHRFGLPVSFLCLVAILKSVSCEQCQCSNNNTVSCNKRSGECICRAGFEGPSCDCIEGRHSCNYNTSYCAVHGDSPVCVCRPGMYGKNLGCFEPLRYIRNTSVVEVFHQGKWMLIGSPYNWTDHTSRVLCGQLGLPITDVSFTSRFLSEAGLLQMDYQNREKLTYLSCLGNETEISQCSFHVVPSISNYTEIPIVLCKNDCRPMMMINMTSALCVPCSCNQSNTVTCNQTTGACVCREDYYGPSCDCIKTREMCNETVSYCSLFEQSETCVCRTGYSGKGLGCFEHLRYIQNTNVVEYYHSNKWMLFKYSFFWEDEFTRVICRQLGLPTFHVSHSFGRDPVSYREMKKYGLITHLWCRGNETEIKQCEMSSQRYIGYYSEFITVKCLDRCPENHYGPTCERCKCNQMNSVKCNNVTEHCSCKEGYFGDTCDCVEGRHSCNETYSFCGASHAVCYCKSQYNRLGFPCEDSIQLYANEQYNSTEGVLRIYQDRTWKTFCLYGLTYESGLVACRGMNLPSRHVTIIRKNRLDVPYEYYTEMSGGPRCKGTERSLFDCGPYRGILGSCYSIPYLQCFSACPHWQYGKKCQKQCKCNEKTSSSCDEDSGKCTCIEGYSGDHCNCKMGVHKCNTNQTYCHTSGNGDSVCLCKRGLSETEYQTEGCFDEYVRLTKLTSAVDGVVEIYRSGIWQGLCLHSIAANEAKVMCRQLGMSWEFSQVSKIREDMPKSYFYKYKFACNGTEKTLLDCDRMRIKPCVAVSARIVCPKAPLIRLISKQTNATATSGLLQVFYKNSWGYFCTERFTDVEARVACRELGLPSVRVSVLKEISVTDDDTHFNYVACDGDEKTLSECRGLGGSVCNVYMRTIVKLICSSNGNCTSLTFGKNCNLRCPCNGPTTTSCDRNTGKCICKSRYTGPSCSCVDKFDKCDSTTSGCYDGTYKPGTCICKKGYTSFQHGCKDHVQLKSDGFVEVIEHEFYRVCSNEFWHYENALVVCRQLNRNTDVLYSVSVPADRFYRVSDKYFKCNGTEKTLLDCPYTLLYSSCQYYHKLICGECPEWMYSSDCSKNCRCDRRTSTECDFRTGGCICQEGYAGADCSCHVSIAEQCDGENTFCDFDKCLCRDGMFNNSLSCSDLNNVIFSCSFNQPSWKEDCHIDPTHGVFINYNNEIKHDKSWRPETGSDGMNYIYVNRRPYYFLKEDSFFVTLQLSLEDTRSGVCLHFDYIIGGYGKITVTFVDEKDIQLSEIVLFETQHNWTTKLFYIRGGHFSSQVRITLEEMTAIDKILITEGICGCANWTFGPSCDDCACVRLHTKFCNKTNGQCHCKPGYTGDACQCVDNGDPCPHYVRLMNGTTPSMGRIEIVTNSAWSTVCGGWWDDKAATVVCRQLGIETHGIALKNAEFGRGDGPMYIKKVDCNGTESDLFKCKMTELSCSHTYVAGVICVKPSEIIRLTGGTDETNGRLELRPNGRGQWGTVCDDEFTEMDARGVCTELGLPTRNVQVKKDAFYGEGRGPVYEKDISCKGNETSLRFCLQWKSWYSCEHDEDVGISCSNGCPPFMYGSQCKQPCVCDQRTSVSCDTHSGECECKTGWTGARCTCSSDTICDQNTFCEFNKCECMDGFYENPTNCSDGLSVLYSCSFESSFDACSITTYNTMERKMELRDSADGVFYATQSKGFNGITTGTMEISIENLKTAKETRSCFEFRFFIRGQDKGDFNVTIEDQPGSEIVRWSNPWYKNSTWNRGFVEFPSRAAMIKFSIAKTKSADQFIHFDDFKILSGRCQCEEWNFGTFCNELCDCHKETSYGCDDITGSCFCRPGWSGKDCLCRLPDGSCHTAYSYCSGSQCVCKDGFYKNGVSCSGLNDVTYFCGFDMSESFENCNTELDKDIWDIKEDESYSVLSGFHYDTYRYLRTRLSMFSQRILYWFSIGSLTLEQDSCLAAKVFISNFESQVLQILVTHRGHTHINRFFRGMGWTSIRISIKASSDVKIYFIAYIYSVDPMMVDDIVITSKPCDVCAQWYYGPDCDQMVICNRSNTLSVDGNGTCRCAERWYGEHCDCSKAENDACLGEGETCRKGRCHCKNGYTRKENRCADLNECNFLCRMTTQSCRNTNGSYICECTPGTRGNADACSESTFAVKDWSSTHEGTLLMWQDNTWGTFCDPFDLFTAKAVCNTMLNTTEIFGVHLSTKGKDRTIGKISYNSIECDHRQKTFDTSWCNVSVGPCSSAKTIYINCGLCGGMYRSHIGIVKLPTNLPSDTLCFFVISPVNAETINASLSVRKNSGNRAISAESCDKSYVEIYDGEDTSATYLGRYCGYQERISFISTGESLLMIYKTSDVTWFTSPGVEFELKYETTNKEFPDNPPENKKDGKWTIPLAVTVFLLIAALVVLIIFVCRRKRFRQQDNTAVFIYSELTATDSICESITGSNMHRPGSVLSLSGNDDRHRISLRDFAEAYEGLCDDVDWPEKEFRTIIQSCHRKSAESRNTSEHISGDRDGHFAIYDFNLLKEQGSTQIDDNINACVIKGLHSHYPYYIVTQYPLITTQDDFWRMIWKRRASSIISLVSNNEEDRIYFPTMVGTRKAYGPVTVQLLTSSTEISCTFRCMKITKGSQSFTLNHYQTSILRSFAKDECQNLVRLISLIQSNAGDNPNNGPVVLHCLNGSGKSGVFLAMDYIIQQIRNGAAHADLFNLTRILISNRDKLIENQVQYQFLFDCVDFYLEQDNQQTRACMEDLVEDEDARLLELETLPMA